MSLRFLVPVALACLLAGGGAARPAAADITAPALWAHWQALAADGPATLQADAALQGNALVLTGPVLSLPLGPATLRLQAERARLAPLADGGVRLDLPAGQTLTLSRDAPGGAVRAEFRLQGTGVALTATGILPRPLYALVSDRLVLTLLSAQDGDAEIPAELVIALDALAGSLSGLDGTAASPVVLDATLADLTASAEALDPRTGTRRAASMAQTDARLEARLFPAAAGASVTAAFSLEGGAVTATSRQSGPAGGAGTGAAETGAAADTAALRLALEQDNLAYAARATGARLSLRADRLPLEEVEIAIADLDAALSLPLAPQEGEGADLARLSLHLSGATAGEALWSLYDPGRALPRTAADLDLVATAELVPVGAFARNAFAAAGGRFLPPVLPRSLEIEDFSLRLADARIEADGRFTTETAVPGAPPDISRPIGALDVTLTGANALLQRLVQGGLIAPGAAFGAQLMMGMFATPGAGDTHSSTIRTEADGGLIVNGTRLR